MVSRAIRWGRQVAPCKACTARLLLPAVRPASRAEVSPERLLQHFHKDAKVTPVKTPTCSLGEPRSIYRREHVRPSLPLWH